MKDKWRSLITGASSGIGKAVAAAIASRGGSVCITGRHRGRLETTAGLMRTRAASVLVHNADLTIDSELAELAQLVQREFGGLDILVHCAGIHFTGSLERIPVEQLDLLYRANIRMPFLLTQALLPLLRAQQGQIVFINSSQGLHASGSAGLFSATQHALKAIADSLREEVNADRIRVLSIFPGRTATPRMKALYEAEGNPYRPELLLQAEDVAQIVIDALALPRSAEVTNIQVRPHIKSY
jgi:NADP-dependent 3-hydroxy acid dehydrogenase YdfG